MSECVELVEIPISNETKRRLEKRKLYAEEPLNDVVDRLLKRLVEG